MLSNLTYSINAVAPIVILVLLGVLLKRLKIIHDGFASAAEQVVFKVALPVMLFTEVANAKWSGGFEGKLILFCVISVTAAFSLAMLLVPLFIKDRAKCGSFVQGACRSNFAILGVPLAENLFGATGTGAIALIMPFVILMFNGYSVIVLSVFSGGKTHRRDRKAVLGILKNIVTNPLIIGVALALPFMLLQIELPVLIDKSLTYTKNLATPLALICLGANFKMESCEDVPCLPCAPGSSKPWFFPQLWWSSVCSAVCETNPSVWC